MWIIEHLNTRNISYSDSFVFLVNIYFLISDLGKSKNCLPIYRSNRVRLIHSNQEEVLNQERQKEQIKQEQ